MSFTGTLRLQEGELDQWRQWMLLEPLSFRNITVPAGFVTDGASVPRPLWWLLPAWGRYSRAAVIHDYLCKAHFDDVDLGFYLTRKIADDLFYEAMVECGVNVTMRWLMWASVRLNAWAKGET